MASVPDRTAEGLAKPRQGGVLAGQLGVLLAVFDGVKSASKARRPLSKKISESGDTVLDEVVLRVDAKRKVQVHNPRRVIAGTLTAALTWGVLGLLASSGSVKSLIIWGVIGAIYGGLVAYYSEHLATKGELKRIGQRMAPGSSAVLAFIHTSNAAELAAKAAKYSPVTASVAAIEPKDLSARVLSGASDPGQPPSAPDDQHPGSVDDPLLSMLLLRFKGRHTARGVETKLSSVTRPGQTLQTELMFEVDTDGKAHVTSPSKGVKAEGRSELISWGLCGLVYGAIVGAANNGGVLSFLKGGVETGIVWAIVGLGAGALYGLWAGRGVSARRLNGIGPLLPPDSSMLLAWADGGVTERSITELSVPDSQRLVVRFNPTGHGVLLEV
jgi:uncharacterized membrane protein